MTLQKSDVAVADPALAPLFTPLTVGSLTLPNRIVMAPMTRMFSPDHVPSDNVAGYYRRRAAGETGLIVTEGVGIDHPASADNDGIPRLAEPATLAGWKHVVDEVHAAKGIIFPQIWHQGAVRDPAAGSHPEIPALRPSGLLGPVGAANALPQGFAERAPASSPPMTESEIADVIAAFARSAAHAKALGFDGIAIHGAHGYLIDEFLWSGTNRRTDGYGGTPANRARFAAEVVKAVRGAIGPTLPVMFRFSQWKMQDYAARIAATPGELEHLLVPIAAAGVDIFDASERVFDTPTFEGSSLNLAGWAKKLTGKITATVGGIDRANLAGVMARFNRGEFDLVSVGRPILADPAWAAKVRRGETPTPLAMDMFARLT